MYENDVPLGFFFFLLGKMVNLIFFLCYLKKKVYNLSTDIFRKPNFVLHISWYLGNPVPPPPPPPQSHFIK